MKRLFLVRHCASTGQEASALLTAIRHTQALRLADHFATQDVELLVSSPYTRAQQSIAPLARCLRLPVETDARLAERVLSATPVLHVMTAYSQGASSERSLLSGCRDQKRDRVCW